MSVRDWLLERMFWLRCWMFEDRPMTFHEERFVRENPNVLRWVAIQLAFNRCSAPHFEAKLGWLRTLAADEQVLDMLTF